MPSIYEVPLCFAQEGVDALILKYLHKEAPEADLTKWKELVDRCYHPKDEVSHRHRRQVCRSMRTVISRSRRR